MLGILTAIVVTAGGLQATMVLPEDERLAAEQTRPPVVHQAETEHASREP